MSNTTTQSVILERNFCDPDEMAATLSHRRNIQIMQLGLQPLQGNLLILELGIAEFLFLTTDTPLRIWGPKASGFLDFAFVISPTCKELITHETAATQDTVFGFDNNRENNLVLPANLKLGVLQIKRDVFEDCLHVMDRTDVDDRFLSTNCLHSPVTLAAVRIYLKELYGLVKQQAAFLTLPQVRKLILEDFVPLLIEAIPLNRNTTLMPDRSVCRSQLVQKAEEYMQAHLEKPITLKDLCKILHTSSRPLNYGFQEVFGMSSMTYLKVLRLRAVYKMLKAADPATTSVEIIANQFGFWSLGHFTRDYKQMFRELPSKPLKRLKGHNC